MNRNYLEKLIKFLVNSNYRWTILANYGFYNRMSDESFLKKKYYSEIGKELNLSNPKSFNEKLQWMKLNNRDSQFTKMVDKYEVRKIVSEKIGEEYLIPLIGVWNNPDEIDFDKLPNQFVLKCNHNSGLGMIICEDKSKLNIKKVKKDLKKGLKQDYYLTGREWPYKNVERKIVAEKFMKNSDSSELKDYKFLCFNGHAELMYIASDRQAIGEETKFDFYDMNFNHLPFTNGHPNSKKKIEKPKLFDQMKVLAEKIARDLNHVRVDFYEIDGKLYFGEITFYHMSGFAKFNPEIWDYKIGEFLNLPNQI